MKNKTAAILISITLLQLIIIFFNFFDIETFASINNSVNVSKKAIVIKIEGYTSLIDVPIKDYVIRALNYAEEKNMPVIIYLDTYGGYLDPALSISKILLDAKVPVIVFVKDKAYSAGVLISVASHILVMKSSAVIGAAQPVAINPVTGEISFINESKILNPILKTMEMCAVVRKRNITTIKRFVYENLVLSGEEAYRYGVADYNADNVNELMSIIRGVEVNISKTIWRLDIEYYEELMPSIDIYINIFLRNSLINSILLFIGIFGTLGLIYSGRIDLLPITIIALALALLGGDIEARAVSMFLIALGAVLLSIELFVTPGFGVIGVTGLAALILGIILIPLPSFLYAVSIEIFWRTILVFLIGFGSLLAFILYKAVAAMKKSKIIKYIPESKVVGKAIDRIEPGKKGYVVIEGELWEAESDEIIERGEEIEVIERKGFTLRIRKRK